MSTPRGPDTAGPDTQAARARADATPRAIDERTLLSRLTKNWVSVTDEKGRMVYVSPSVTRVLGYRPQDYIGTTGVDHVHPDDVAHLVDLWTAMLATPGAEIRYECRARAADGTWRQIEGWATNLLDDPDVGGVVTDSRDITDYAAAREAIRVQDTRFRALVQNAADAVMVFGADGTITYCSPAIEPITGARPEDLEGLRWQDLSPLESLDERDRWFATMLERPDRIVETRTRIDRAAGPVWIEATVHNRLGDPDVRGIVANIRDVTARVETENRLRESEERSRQLAQIVETTSDLVAVTHRSGELLYMNDAGRRFFAITEQDYPTFDYRPLTPDWAAKVFDEETLPALRSERIWSGEIAVLRHGVEVPVSVVFIAHVDRDGHLERVSSITRDISERKRFEQRLTHQANHDPLTGLPNRTLLLDRLRMALARSDRRDRPVALVFLDLDHFKLVNDSLGHRVGDELLVAIAQRLTQVVRPGDTVARFGGDEFVILSEDLRDEAQAEAIAERVRTACSGTFRLSDDVEVFTTVSAGMVVTTRADPEDVIRDADAAMYRAKELGRSRLEHYDTQMRVRAVERLDLETGLRRALDRGEIRVHYQPMFAVADGHLTGVEALLRWEHPRRGLLSADQFIGIAEETGLIVALGRWVVERAMHEQAVWHRSGWDDVRLLVNLSGRQLVHPHLVDDLARAVSDAGGDPSSVVLEITESVLMDDVEATLRAVGALRRAGYAIAVDDFGTGYSSLAYLKRFPVDMLKVDRTFVDGLGTDPEDSAIVAAVVSLARALGLTAVAEGVETDGQLAELATLGCDLAQGHLLGRPVSADEITGILGTRSTPSP